MKFNFVKKSLLVLLLASSALAFSFADTATVISVSGKVEVNRNNAWIPLEKNTELREGEVISTGFKSEALIKYKDSVMKLGPLTRITLEKLTSSDSRENVAVYLNTGSVRSTVNHTGNKRTSYTVRNPIAVASVRGTDFEMDGSANVECFDGGVIVVPAESVNPARDLGIANPVGGNPSDESESPDNSPEPEDGTTNSFTSGSDINPNFSGGVLITGGQSTDFSDSTTSNPTRARTDAEKNATSFSSGFNTASTSEFSPTADTTGDDSESNSNTKKKGKLIINLVFED